MIHQRRVGSPLISRTAAVQVGARSSPGTASAARAGKNTQWKPRSRIRTAATTRSSASLKGDANPSPKIGAMAICSASAANASPRAARILPGVARVGALEGAVELVGSIDDLPWERLGQRVDGGVQLLHGRGPEQDRVDAGAGSHPLVGQLHRRPTRFQGEPGEGVRQLEETVAEIPLLVHRVLVEARPGFQRGVPLELAGQETSGQRVVHGGMDAVLLGEAEILDL